MRATGMKSPTENESCSTCGRSEFRFGSPNSMTCPSAALLSTYSAPTTPPPPRADHRDHRLAEMGLGGRGDDAGMEHVRAAERIRRDELQQLIGECTCGAC